MKHVCENFIFNKAAGWRHNINIKSLIQMHFFYCVARNKIKGFYTICTFCSYSWLESPVLVCIPAISYLILGVLVMICEKTSKPNKTRFFFKTFYEKIAFFKYHRFTHSLNYIIAMKHFAIFLFILQCIHYTRFDWFYYFRKLFYSLYF